MWSIFPRQVVQLEWDGNLKNAHISVKELQQFGVQNGLLRTLKSSVIMLLL